MSAATKLTNDIINHIYARGGYAWRASSVGVFDQQKQAFRTAPKKGVSDILACFNGRLIAVEVKIGKDRLSDEQVGFMMNIKNVGGCAFVAVDFDNFLEQWNLAEKNMV